MKTLNSLLLSAVVTLATASAHATSAMEVIMGVSYDEQGLTYQVKSGGCTSKADFELLQRQSYPPQIVLVRTSGDVCTAYLPYGTKITYTWAELGWVQHTEFKIANPIQTGVFAGEVFNH